MKKLKDVDKVCEVYYINEDRVKRVKPKLLAREIAERIAETFKAMGDLTRLRIIHTLSKEELCVCDLSKILDINISAVSHQLRVLRNLKLVKFRREGKIVYYSLADDHILKLIMMEVGHAKA